MEYQDIILERMDGWIEITINRPEKLNSLRDTTATEILAVLSEVEGDRAVRAVILKGSDKAFCSGIDTSEFTLEKGQFFDFYRKRKRTRPINVMFRDVGNFTKPLISAVEGFCLGGGLELAMVGDIIVAGENAKFGLPEIKLGMMPGGGGTQTLTRRIGAAMTKELIWTGRRFTPQEAKEMRLVNHVVPAGDAVNKAREIAQAIAGNAPLPVMMTKGVIDRGIDMAFADGLQSEADVSFMLYFSGDRDEGLAAFKEKRAPNFRGE